ncbi:MAG: CRISPR-associated helicase Cas3' [Sphaerochaeta sp.]
MEYRAHIAHVSQDSDGVWTPPHLLLDHLHSVASLAEEFANFFQSNSWASLAGYAHDLGKSTNEWQRYIRRKSGYDTEAYEPDSRIIGHAALGAAVLSEHLDDWIARLISYSIAGHHAGLPDFHGSRAALHSQLESAKHKIHSIPENFLEPLKQYKNLTLPRSFSPSSIDLSFWLRMIFSCLVDADFLDTEAYMQNDLKMLRGVFPSLSQMQNQYDAYMKTLLETNKHNEHLLVNKVREKVRIDCLHAAKLSPGFFSLTVPTGGGKTLSSLGFSLNHANQYALRRIIYVIPYTSIIEQNADVFKQIFGEENVIEHHSNFDSDHLSPKVRLASENWDAPIIVTTSVQFFESLFASKPSRCRKLHNITESIIIFDEAQLLPPEYLHPILESLQQLQTHYRCSILFCTATQPVFEKRGTFPSFPGLPTGSVREIISNVPDLYRDLARVEFTWYKKEGIVNSWDEIAKELLLHEQVLCIVSDRKSCRELFSLLPEDNSIHLSALMCPQHRSEVIENIKQRLKQGLPVRVISTQLIEAGVDIDFPTVYRALAGVDSIVQAAGRCNREGQLKGKLGSVVLFRPPNKPPPGFLRKAYDTTETLLAMQQEIQFHNPNTYSHYFMHLYWKANSLDEKGILDFLTPAISDDIDIRFRSAAEAFQFIDDQHFKTILVPYQAGARLIDQLKQAQKRPEISTRKLFRKLQRYTVSIYNDQFNKLIKRGSLQEIFPEVYTLSNDIEYSDKIGLLVDEIPRTPEFFIVD